MSRDSSHRGSSSFRTRPIFGRVGLSVCYDLRFPELYRGLVALGTEILLVPAAFTAVTGEAHWEVLLRARAIEDQCFVVAPAQWGPWGPPEDGRRCYGNSMVVDPWGRVLVRAGAEGDGVWFADPRHGRAPARPHHPPGARPPAARDGLLMRRELTEGYELDDDRERVDVEAVFRFLAGEAYWVRGRDRDTIARLVRESTRVIAAYAPDGALAGFLRVISDGSNVAWLGDVFVVEAHRGRGLATELVREAVEDPRYRDCLWYLNTRDAHGLYERFGFRPADPGRTLVRERPQT